MMEFRIYVFNLRGNQRTSGETSRREGGKIFGSGSRTPVAITLLVKKPNHKGKAVIHYRDIGDYLSREEKLEIVAKSHNALHNKMEWQTLQPNEHADWLNQRNDLFGNFIPLGDKDNKDNKQTIFVPYYSNGLKTNADVWMYNSRKEALAQNMTIFSDTYNSEVERYCQSDKAIPFENFADMSPQKIKWHSGIIPKAANGVHGYFDYKKIVIGLYRPYEKQYAYFDAMFVQRVAQIPKFFPTPLQNNLIICVSGVGASKEFSTIITDNIPDVQLQFNGQCFPLYYYEKRQFRQSTLFDSDKDEYIRRDALTDFILDRCRNSYGARVTKEDIFYYVYGLLHSPDYRAQFAADLKKMLPRLPIVEKPADFWSFSKAGRELANLHLNYEDQPPCPAVTVTGAETGKFQVEKMRFPKKEDKSVIEYNAWIKLSGIPPEAYEYVVNSRSAIEWIMERYQIKVDKDSGIKNDPNDWGAEHGKPSYILDLLQSIITVSLETRKIINGLPKLHFY